MRHNGINSTGEYPKKTKKGRREKTAEKLKETSCADLELSG
jgi:hypothetical protein